MTAENSIKRARAALRSLFVADALSMPVHWFYNPLHIVQAFPGGIKKMEAAPAFHPSSIMSLHSTHSGGRGKQGKSSSKINKSSTELEIVGDMILKDKRPYWGVPNTHYHQGMPAGENTLNAWCARVLINSIVDQKQYESAEFLQSYVDFMTSEKPQHPDTYAESYHRGFFANLAKGQAPEQCAAVTHDTPSIGGLVTVVPLAIFSLLRGKALAEVQLICRGHLQLTHPDPFLDKVSDSLIALIHELLQRPNDADPAPYLIQAGRVIPKLDLQSLLKTRYSDIDVVGRKFSSACYITDSWPSMLYLAAKYQPDVKSALLANTNAGGENAHRGAVLGSIVGLISASTSEELYDQLLHGQAICKEIDQLLELATA